MSYDGPSLEQSDLMRKIAQAKDGYETSARNPQCDALARHGYVQCRRSKYDGVTEREWWWLTDAGKAQIKPPVR
jgi:hypothetical protein